MKTKSTFAGCVLAGFSCAVFGQANPQSNQESFPDEMSRLDAQTALLNKRAQVRDLQERDAKSSFGAGLPRVTAIFGFEGNLAAKLQMSDGSVRTFQRGEAIADLLFVTAISANGVYVSFGNRKIQVMLPFASAGGPGAQMQQASVPAALLSDAPAVPMPRPAPIPVQRTK